MIYDRNPKFAIDQSFQETAGKVTGMLWETTSGNLSSIPRPYLENLKHCYSDGSISMLELIDRLDLPSEATWEDYCEVVDVLMSVNPSEWPNPDNVQEVQVSKLLFNIEPEELDFNEEEWEFAEPDDLSTKIEKFLKKVIASVYMDGVTSVTDSDGNPPNVANNYLMSEDGKSFGGLFFDKGGEEEKSFTFVISESSEGNWSIKY